MKECMKDTDNSAPETGKRPARYTKVAVGMESSGEEFGILEDERCTYKGVFQNRCLVHESVLACDDIPPRPHISFILLTQSDRRALRTVARCEGALLRVAGAMRARVT